MLSKMCILILVMVKIQSLYWHAVWRTDCIAFLSYTLAHLFMQKKKKQLWAC